MEKATCESGVCRIKHEFVLQEKNLRPAAPAEDLPEEEEEDMSKNHGADAETGETDVTPSKKRRLTKREKKKQRGQNRARPTYKCDRKRELCYTLVSTLQNTCSKNDCPFLHDVKEYLKIKPPDIGETCYNFETSGKCNRGVSCRFAGQHTDLNGANILDEQKFKVWESNEPHTINHLLQDLQQNLRKKNYDFKLSEALIKYNDHLSGKQEGTVTDEDVIKLTSREKKVIDFKDKLSLSPLTTVGNLPFRRICKEFGADITCGEMAMCSAILQGAPQEWALVKRHHTEDIFGVQLCANNPHLLTKCGQLLQEEINIDFIDLNLGCPIELVYKEGAGCGLLRRPKVLESCIRNLSQILRIPLTVKTRTGVYSNENVAHTLIPKFRDWGASLVTLHGRSREQRYTKLANWSYIEQCAQAASPMPLFGNGDILSYEDYKAARETCPSISGVVIGRGALIKPWLFTEIKERKLWDISSSERFDILKKYVNYGLEHWGSDNKGVENTRRFLLEWLSFLYRYIPVGLLERPPQKINERPPYYRGRDDLETLMASPVSSDWIKISEMFLGPVPENFQFLPKHKANSYK